MVTAFVRLHFTRLRRGLEIPAHTALKWARKRESRFQCPDCGESITPRIGAWACPQCRAKLIYSVNDTEVRVSTPVVEKTEKVRFLPNTRSYPFEIGDDGVPRYWCLQCGDPFPVSQCRTTKQVRIDTAYGGLGIKRGGTITEVVLRKSSKVVGWKDRQTIYEVINGQVYSRQTAVPIMVNGPVCPLCS